MQGITTFCSTWMKLLRPKYDEDFISKSFVASIPILTWEYYLGNNDSDFP